MNVSGPTGWLTWCAISLLSLSGCAHLPALAPFADAGEEEEARNRCEAVAPRIAFRAVHTLDARLPFERGSAMIGVSAADPESGRLRAALVSAEGLTLFEGARDEAGQTRILRAVPPLDAPDFGPMLFDDVALVLLMPRGSWHLLGRNDQGWATCRAQARSWSYPGGTLDVTPEADGRVVLRLYDRHHHLQREVRQAERNEFGLFGRVRLEAPGVGGYVLLLRLLESEPLFPDDPALVED
jgi:hypothetical protein